MNEENGGLNQVNKTNSELRNIKKQFLLIKILSLIVVGVFVYFGYRYYQIREAVKNSAKTEVGKFDNIENEIFDLSEEYKAQGEDQDPSGLAALSTNEMEERGAEFVYQSLLKNQLQINDLKTQVQSVKDEFSKYKNREKITKIIFSYIDLRQKIFANNEVSINETNDENVITGYEDSLKNSEMLVALDNDKLQENAVKLRPLLEKFVNQKSLIKEFDGLIPNLIIAKGGNVDGSFISRIRNNIAKLIIIRRIDGKKPQEIDATIVKIEKLLQEQNYQEALNNLVALDPLYHSVIVNFLDKLNVALEVQKIDQEILSYLKTLS